jgi:alkylation response protein AidB-like acyl-CoA dehydrogenase
VNFDYNEEQRLLAESVRRFVAQDYSFEARRRIVDSAEGYSAAIWRTLADLGLLALPVPAAFGGFGGGAVDMMSTMEAIGEALVVEPYLPTVGLGTRMIVEAGSEAQQAELLPAIAEGRLILAFAHTERDGRHDLSHVTVTARRAGEGFVLDGEKKVVLHAPSAGKLIVTARTSGAPDDARGVSLFLVDTSQPGLEMTRYRTLDGIRAADVVLRNVAVPAAALLGPLDAGLEIAEEAVDFATALVCAEAVGAMKSANEATLEYLKTRKQFGVPIGSFQALQHRMVDMTISAEQARSMASLACARVDARPAAEERRPHRLGGEGADRGRLPPREPGIGAAPRRHGHERGAEGEPYLPAAHDDRAAIRRRGSPPRKVCARFPLSLGRGSGRGTMINKQILLASHPEGAVSPEHFRLVEAPLGKPGAGEVLVRNEWLSLDPYMRGRMSKAKSYAKGVEVGEVMVGQTVGEVLESGDASFKQGDKVLTPLGWQLAGVAKAADLTKVDASRVPASYYLGILGMPGITAWFGLHEIGQPKAGDTLVVSAASGAVGSVVGQLGKIAGCRVVGIAGGQAKCDYVRDELGFDAVVDYKAPGFDEALRAAVPKGVDIYFDNVGGADPRRDARAHAALLAHRGVRPHLGIQRHRGVRHQAHPRDPREPHQDAGHDRVRLEGPVRGSDRRARGAPRRRTAQVPRVGDRRAGERAAGLHGTAEGRELRKAASAASVASTCRCRGTSRRPIPAPAGAGSRRATGTRGR